MYVEACLLWSLIDLQSFRCPYHVNELREEPDGNEPEVSRWSHEQ